MPAVYGQNYSLILAAPAARQPIPNDYGGEAKYVWDTYLTLGTETAGYDIVLGRLRKNYRLLDWQIAFGNLGASVTLGMGDDASATRFKAQTAAATAGTFGATWDVNNLGYLAPADRLLQLRTAGATLAAGILIVSRAIIGRL